MFEPIGNKELLSKKIAKEIENAINSNILKVGDKLPTELELCEQFGVSRTAVREALRSLSAMGLISIEKGRGIFVKKPSSDTVSIPLRSYLLSRIGSSYILDVVESRLIIEPEIARAAALNRDEEDIKHLREIVEELRGFHGNSNELAAIDMKFHLTVARSTKNRVLPLMLKPIFSLMPEIKSKIIKDIPEAIKSAVIWHEHILEAIAAGDPNEASRIMKEHLMIAKEHAKEMLRIEHIE